MIANHKLWDITKGGSFLKVNSRIPLSPTTIEELDHLTKRCTKLGYRLIHNNSTNNHVSYTFATVSNMEVLSLTDIIYVNPYTTLTSDMWDPSIWRNYQHGGMLCMITNTPLNKFHYWELKHTVGLYLKDDIPTPGFIYSPSTHMVIIKYRNAYVTRPDQLLNDEGLKIITAYSDSHLCNQTK